MFNVGQVRSAGFEPASLLLEDLERAGSRPCARRPRPPRRVGARQGRRHQGGAGGEPAAGPQAGAAGGVAAGRQGEGRKAGAAGALAQGRLHGGPGAGWGAAGLGGAASEGRRRARAGRGGEGG